jgi:hypothetical protein
MSEIDAIDPKQTFQDPSQRMARPVRKGVLDDCEYNESPRAVELLG